jgi:uncharacterized protein (TIGR02600 family)
MNLPSPVSPQSRASRQGMALFVVLAVLVLVAAVVVGFFASTASEARSSKMYASGASSRQLADSAVQIAIAQVLDATSGTNASGPVAWASQPGMIRTYASSGSAATFYKLYSSDSLVIDGANFDPTNEMPPVNWDAQPGVYTDLNAPVTRDGATSFPIVDPRAKSSSASQSVAGFDYTSALNGTVQPGGAADSQRLPMPVRWLYVLENGQFAIPVSSSGGVVTFDPTDPARLPSGDNPIVGRIAFWTDDETCKLNINTASEGTPWDRPWANTTTEQSLATSIPVQNEFQRYPGHPATTSLSTVFGALFPVTSNLTGSALASALTPYYRMTPRVEDGGTRGGTEANKNYATNPPSDRIPVIQTDQDRLLGSVDELLFAPSSTAGERDKTAAALDNDFLQKARFFLTARNRSPELNLFGKPRLTLWPLPEESKRNAKDKLLAFCSEIGGEPFYFQRSSMMDSASPSSQSTTADWNNVARNRDLYAYLDRLAGDPIPGYGDSFVGKYGQGRTRQILTQMFDLIRSGVNNHNNALTPAYDHMPPQLTKGEGQVVPLRLPNGTNGFGRFFTITEAAVVFYRSDLATDAEAALPDAFPDPATFDPTTPTTRPSQMRAVLLLEPFTPSPGLPFFSPHVQIVIKGLENFAVTADAVTSSLNFPPNAAMETTARLRLVGGGHGTGFLAGPQTFFRYESSASADSTKQLGLNPVQQYPFASTAATPAIPAGTTSFNFSGGPLTIEIYPAGVATSATNLIQRLTLDFPPANNLPLPRILTPLPATWSANPPNRFSNNFNNRISSVNVVNNNSWNIALIVPGDVVRSVELDGAGPTKGDLRLLAGLREVPANYFAPSPGYDSVGGNGLQQYRFAHGLRSGTYSGWNQYGYSRVYAGYAVNPKSPNNTQLMDSQSTSGYLVEQARLGAWYSTGEKGYIASTAGANQSSVTPAMGRGVNGAFNQGGRPGDWDTMTGTIEDGSYINKPDEGTSETTTHPVHIYENLGGGYFSRGTDWNSANDFGGYKAETGQTFSPNRQVSSAVMFGSLPTGIDPFNPGAPAPWQTLLFSATPAAGPSHPGFASPPDHLMLDWFTMPIVEPYAISEPFSSAGKVNMNYQIMPFTNIRRSTGLHAVMKATRLMAIPSQASTRVTSNVASWKEGQKYPYELRFDINPDESGGTLEGFEERFADGDVFRSASEICEIPLVPRKIAGKTYPSNVTDPTFSTVRAWWDTGGPGGDGFRLTGDNLREQPYGVLYPRLTTKSNTFTVHYKVQTLQKSSATPPAQWVEGRDKVTGESRGSATFERYIDPNDSALPDFAAANAPSADGFYRLRIIGSTTFSP